MKKPLPILSKTRARLLAKPKQRETKADYTSTRGKTQETQQNPEKGHTLLKTHYCREFDNIKM